MNQAELRTADKKVFLVLFDAIEVRTSEIWQHFGVGKALEL